MSICYFVDTKSCLRMVFNATFNNISFISWQSYVRDKSIKHKAFNIAMVMLLQDLPIIHKQIIEHVHLLHQLFSSVHVQESEILTIKYLYKNYLLTYYTHKRDMSLRAVYILELQICKRLPKTITIAILKEHSIGKSVNSLCQWYQAYTCTLWTQNPAYVWCLMPLSTIFHLYLGSHNHETFKKLCWRSEIK
jgi:hypothetical protein